MNVDFSDATRDQTKILNEDDSPPSPDGKCAYFPTSPTEGFTLFDPIHFGIFGAVSGSWKDDSDLHRIGTIVGTGVGMTALSSATRATAREVSIKTVGRTVPIVGMVTAGITTAEMMKRNQNKTDIEKSIKEQVRQFLCGEILDYQKFVGDIILSDLSTRTNIANGVGYAGDYIASGSSFFLMFPPVAIAGFALGTAVKLGGELSKYHLKLGIRNIYDLIAEQIIKNIEGSEELERLLPLLEAKGLSADGMYRLELWCFFRAIEKFGTTPQHENLLIALEGKLLSIIDYMSTAEGYEEQLRRELNPTISAGQLTFCHASSGKETLHRVQATGRCGDVVHGLRCRMARAIKKNLPSLHQTTDLVIALAINRAITASMAEFELPSMILARIAFKLYVYESPDKDFIACSDQMDYRDCHFVVSDTTIEMLRVGIFRVEAVSTTNDQENDDGRAVFIPFMRRVTIPISIEHLRMREEFQMLSGHCYKKISNAAKQLPSKGIPKPFINWEAESEETIEQQMKLLGNGIVDASGENKVTLAERKENLLSRRRFEKKEKQLSQRHFVQCSRKNNTMDSHTVDELLAAVTRLILANNAQTIDKMKSKALIESMLSLCQDVNRSVTEWLSDKDQFSDSTVFMSGEKF